MVRQGRTGDLDRLLDLADRHFALGLHKTKKTLKPADVRERFEGLDVCLVGRQLRQG